MKTSKASESRPVNPLFRQVLLDSDEEELETDAAAARVIDRSQSCTSRTGSYQETKVSNNGKYHNGCMQHTELYLAKLFATLQSDVFMYHVSTGNFILIMSYDTVLYDII